MIEVGADLRSAIQRALGSLKARGPLAWQDEIVQQVFSLDDIVKEIGGLAFVAQIDQVHAGVGSLSNNVDAFDDPMGGMTRAIPSLSDMASSGVARTTDTLWLLDYSVRTDTAASLDWAGVNWQSYDAVGSRFNALAIDFTTALGTSALQGLRQEFEPWKFLNQAMWRLQVRSRANAACTVTHALTGVYLPTGLKP